MFHVINLNLHGHDFIWRFSGCNIISTYGIKSNQLGMVGYTIHPIAVLSDEPIIFMEKSSFSTFWNEPTTNLPSGLNILIIIHN